MITVFVDSYYFLAVINNQDAGHARAVSFGDAFRGKLVTTEWVLTEVGDALAQSRKRNAFLALLSHLSDDPRTEIIEASHALFVRGVDLFAQRADKDWSLTDCISFVVMDAYGLREALTADRHFEQAGFTTLLA